MENENKQNDDNIQSNDSEKYYFEVWKYYEEVAMHFNVLIIKLRTQSVGGLAALATIVGIVLKSSAVKSGVFNYGLAALSIICLILFWVAIWMLDLRYYNRLLEGAVSAILELEKDKNIFLKKKEIKLSSNIERAFQEHFEHEPKELRRIFNGRNGFYLFVFFALFIVLVCTLIKWCQG